MITTLKSTFNNYKISDDLYNILNKYYHKCVVEKNYTGILNIVTRFQREKYFEEILKLTAFLNENVLPNERLYCIYNNIEHTVKCKYCNNPAKFLGSKNGYHDICNNNECINKKTKKTCIERYGVENYTQTDEYHIRCKNTCIERYGVESYTQTDEFNEKRKKTCIERYGVDHQMKNKDIKKKIANTFTEKYGQGYLNKKAIEKYNSLTDEEKQLIKDKKSNTFLSKYGLKSSLQLPHVREKMQITHNKNTFKKCLDICDSNNTIHISYNEEEGFHKCKCKKCGEEFIIKHYILLRCKNISNDYLCDKCSTHPKSYFEIEVNDYLKNLGIKTEINKRFYYTNRKYYECDIYLPEYNIGFECNGTYWHSDILKDHKYHIDKRKYLKTRGVNLFFIWDDLWNNKNAIVKSYINTILNRNININYYNIDIIYDNNTIKNFINENSLFNYIKSDKSYGIFYNNLLIGIISYKTSKIKNIITNFAILNGYNIEEKYINDIILKICDIDNIKLEFHIDLDLKYISNTYNESPKYYWIIKGNRYNKNEINKKFLENLGYDNSISKTEFIYENLNGYKIYNSGEMIINY